MCGDEGVLLDLARFATMTIPPADQGKIMSTTRQRLWKIAGE